MTLAVRAIIFKHMPRLIVGLFAVYSLVLLAILLSSQNTLRDATESRLVADSQRRASVIAGFLEERSLHVQELAKSRELHDYLTNKDLGMSMRYGLRVNVQAIQRKLDDALYRSSLRGQPVLVNLAYHDEAGELLVSVGSAHSSANSQTAGVDPALAVDTTAGRYEISVPVVFRGQMRGVVRAEGELAMLSALLIAEQRRDSDIEYAEVVTDGGGRILASPLSGLGPAGLPRRLGGLEDGRILPLDPAVGFSDTPHALMALRVPINGLPMSLVTVVSRNQLYGQLASPVFMTSVALIPFVLLIGLLAYESTRERSVRLKDRAEASERDRARLVDDNAELARLAAVFTHTREGVLITDANGVILEVNDALCRITGYPRDEVIGNKPSMFRSGRQGPEFYEEMWSRLRTQGYWSGEIWNRGRSGELFVVLQTVSSVRDENGRIAQFVAVFTDISAQKAYQAQLEHVAHYDALTGLPNRTLLADRMRQAMTQAQRRKTLVAVAYLDLDGFKAVNDEHGHDAGDRLLVTVSERMRAVLREGDTLARLGGDEFVVLLLDLPNTEACAPTLLRLLAAASRAVQDHDGVLQVSASIGVSIYPQAELMDADQLLRQADQAMYQAKLAGKNRFHMFDLAQDRAERGLHESVERIRKAIVSEELVLHYQPKVNMRSGVVVGVEALVRWQHPQRGLMPPADFLPLIEALPLGTELGDWVLNTALRQLDAWQRAGLNLSLSLNVTAHQLQQAGFFEHLLTRLACYPELDASRLELEVLESGALNDLAQVSRIMKSCRSVGVGFALDDFGTGFSSLTYLKNLPAQTLKIDRSFVRGVLDDADDQAIIEGVLGLARAFRRQPVAEGVESVAHGVRMLELGCQLAQGFAIAPPMPAEAIPGWVMTWRPPAEWAGKCPRLSAIPSSEAADSSSPRSRPLSSL